MRKMIPIVKYIEEEMEEDIYSEESLSELDEEDSINPADQGFMLGYLSS